jgi:3-oxoacyl-[acyl-carrier-protein] synthase II
LPEVVITGLGPVAPNGVGREQFWEALKDGRSGIRFISRFDTTGYPCQIAGEIPLEWLPLVDSTREPHTSRTAQLIIEAAKLALKDAGISKEEFSAHRSGVWVGVSTTDMGVAETEHLLFKQSGSSKAYVIPSGFPHAPTSAIASEFGCQGRVETISVGCPSGLFSIIDAAESILKGEVEMALAGGGDAPLSPFIFASFCALGFLADSVNDIEPSTASRPFDAKREGGVLSEGAGMVLLEYAERARVRGAKIYARIVGWGKANAFSRTSMLSAYVSSMTQALRKAQLSPYMVDYICAHAPGDKFVDRIETAAIKKTFGPYAYNLPVSSLKSMIGNPLAASGPLQVIAATQVIENKFIPPTINYQYPDPHCDLDCVPNKGRVARVNTALVNIHGLGGCNASLVITRH